MLSCSSSYSGCGLKARREGVGAVFRCWQVMQKKVEKAPCHEVVLDKIIKHSEAAQTIVCLGTCGKSHQKLLGALCCREADGH